MSLSGALDALAKLQNPSVAKILRGQQYLYEAAIVDQVVTEWKREVEKVQPAQTQA